MKCNRCQHLVPSNANFCGSCGHKMITPSDSLDYNKSVKKISVFFFTLLAYVGLFNFVDFGSDYIQTLLIDLSFALIILFFYFFERNNVNRLFRFSKPKISLLIKIFIFTPIVAILVSYFAEILNHSIFNSNQSTYYQHFINSPAPITLTIISIGVVPAIFEEIAFRGILFNELNNIVRVKSTIVISAFLFTILHLSLISIIWIFPMGLLFGYFRAKYRNIWYGIVIHFIYNSSIVIIEIISLSY